MSLKNPHNQTPSSHQQKRPASPAAGARCRGGPAATQRRWLARPGSPSPGCQHPESSRAPGLPSLPPGGGRSPSERSGGRQPCLGSAGLAGKFFGAAKEIHTHKYIYICMYLYIYISYTHVFIYRFICRCLVYV